jgi:para-nitrobenzyl esterase
MGICTITVAPAFAQDEEASDEHPHYSVETTTIGTLLDDPESAAILERLIPTVYANDLFQTMGRPNTLRVAAQYEAAVLTEAKMAEIQAAFDDLAAGSHDE